MVHHECPLHFQWQVYGPNSQLSFHPSEVYDCYLSPHCSFLSPLSVGSLFKAFLPLSYSLELCLEWYRWLTVIVTSCILYGKCNIISPESYVYMYSVLHSSPVCIDTSQIIFHIHPLVSGRKAYAACSNIRYSEPTLPCLITYSEWTWYIPKGVKNLEMYGNMTDNYMINAFPAIFPSQF